MILPMSGKSLNTGSKIRILTVDDHALVREGLKYFIAREDDLTVCGEASDRASALKACETLAPDLALVDLCLGPDSGLDLIKDMGRRFPDIKTLVISMQDEEFYAERALRAGARGYLSKDAGPDMLVEAIRCVLSGEIYVSEPVVQKIMRGVKNKSVGKNPIDRLSDRELDIFSRIGAGHSTAQIAEMLHLSGKTIETYRSRIKTKMGIESARQLAQRAVLWKMASEVA